MKPNIKVTISILVGLFMVYNNICIGQIDFRSSVYKDVSISNQTVKFGEFGCNYEIVNKIGSNKRIKESLIKIPNKGSLKIEFDYNEHGDIVYEQISYNSQKIEIKRHYEYDTIKPEHNNLTLYKIAKQTTTIDSLEPFVIYSIQGENSFETMKEQLRNLKRIKDQTIFTLLGEFPKTKTYNLPACNCQSELELELVDQIYDYKLLMMNEKDGIFIGPGRRNGTLYYIGDTKKDKWRLEKVMFNYNQSNYLVENYKYKK